ncbi:ABC transporter permease [Mycobacterium sp. pV006]|uniref:ABC transporter permease n=1 Tax=Mycobacterium sp. pV006 TaxID=3238983 RepID=UPI00351B2AF9
MTTTVHRHRVDALSPGTRAAALVGVLTVLIALVAIAFALPAARSGPHDVPVGAAGPQAAGGQIAQMLEHQAPGAFEVSYFPGEDALRDAIADREVYGGLVLPDRPGSGPKMLIATGASPAVAQLLTQLGTGIGAKLGTAVPIEDVAPPTADDPRGTGLAASALPITLAGILPAVAFLLVLPGRPVLQTGSALAFAAVCALTVTALLRYVMGSIDQNFWGVAAALTLGIAAALLFLLGLGSVFGRIGLATGVLLALLVGNPLSGLTSAPEMLPAGWGDVGQLLPQGATATLLRSAAAFGGAGSATAILVLACWAIAGVALIGVAALRTAEFRSR